MEEEMQTGRKGKVGVRRMAGCAQKLTVMEWQVTCAIPYSTKSASWPNLMPHT